jgi:hypothetical protein
MSLETCAGIARFSRDHKKLTGAYVPEVFTNTLALTSHADVLSNIQYMKDFCHITREQLIQRIFGQRGGVTSTPAMSDSSRAVKIAANIILLTS